MYIKSLDLDNFRTYESLHLDLEKGITILYGDNAQGKTNILEAIYLCASNKSHRGAKDREMIRFDQEESHLKMITEKEEMEYRIDLHLKKNKNKGIAVNLVPVRKTRDFLGIIHCVLFSPEDLQIVKEGPAERRKFIDTELCMLDKIYLNSYVQYKKALEQRNQLLKDISFEPSLKDTLDVWENQLVKFGKEIIKRRQAFINDLRDITRSIHSHLSGGRENLNIFYEANVSADDLEKELRLSREKDLRAKTTNVGPHRDDMSFMITDNEDPSEKKQEIDARIYGSQGQQRTCALSLKMAEIELVTKKTGEKPVLLLDDVLSELDSGRQKYLLDSLQDIQTLITCTGLEDFVSHQFETNQVYRVEKGKVTRETV